jgi:hypothetical protein
MRVYRSVRLNDRDRGKRLRIVFFETSHTSISAPSSRFRLLVSVTFDAFLRTLMPHLGFMHLPLFQIPLALRFNHIHTPIQDAGLNTSAFPFQSSTLTPEEVNVRKLLHLLHIAAQRDLLVVEQRPALTLAFGQVLLDERNVVACVNRGTLVADDAAEAELRGLRVLDFGGFDGLRVCGRSAGFVVAEIAGGFGVVEEPVDGAFDVLDELVGPRNPFHRSFRFFLGLRYCCHCRCRPQAQWERRCRRLPCARSTRQ